MFEGIDIQLDMSCTRIEIPTEEIIQEAALVDMLNCHSTRISNPIGQGITCWHYDDGEQVMFALMKLQQATLDDKKEISYRWIEECIPALIIQYGDTLPPLNQKPLL